MTSEQRDPREAVLDSIVHSAWQAGTQYYKASPIAESLARLDAADPLRAILPEVVEAFYKIATLTDPRRPLSTDPQTVADVWEITRAALARIREIHPTGDDHGR